jgi:autotransporter-associated beta strand protein
MLLCATSPVSAQTYNLGGNGSWNSTASWNPTTIPNATGASATFNDAASGSNPAQTASRTVTADAVQTIGSINFNADAANAFTTSITTGTSGSKLTFDEVGAGPATITASAAVGTGNLTISAPMVLTDSLTVVVNNITASSTAGAVNLTATITGAGGFTKQGDGLATFGTGAKTYAGPTVISGGRIRMSSAASPTATSSFTINGGQVDLISAATFTFGGGPLNLNGTGPTSGPYATFPGAIRNDTGLIVTINNSVVLQSDTLLHVEGTSGSITFPNAVSGTGKLTFAAPNSSANQGQLILNGANTYQGGTFINGGTILVSGASATLGTGDVTVDNTASPASIAKLMIASGVTNAISDTATLSLAGGGTAGVADQSWVDLGAGVNEVVGTLKLAGVVQVPGTYGSTSSSATFQNNEFFSGTGIITVVAPPTPPQLSIALATPNVVVSWPTNSTGYTLEEKITADNTTTWATNTTPVIISGTNNTVTLGLSNATTFYRLIK